MKDGKKREPTRLNPMSNVALAVNDGFFFYNVTLIRGVFSTSWCSSAPMCNGDIPSQLNTLAVGGISGQITRMRVAFSFVKSHSR